MRSQRGWMTSVREPPREAAGDALRDPRVGRAFAVRPVSRDEERHAALEKLELDPGAAVLPGELEMAFAVQEEAR